MEFLNFLTETVKVKQEDGTIAILEPHQDHANKREYDCNECVTKMIQKSGYNEDNKVMSEIVFNTGSLPDPKEGYMYIVPDMAVAAMYWRDDLCFPIEPVYDENNNLLYYESLCRGILIDGCRYGYSTI